MGACTACLPGTFECGLNGTHAVIFVCDGTGNWPASYNIMCSSSYSCDATNGTCVHGLFHPRDLDFEVPALLRDVPELTLPGLRTRDVLDMAVGVAFT
jgi:hypothetical protein